MITANEAKKQSTFNSTLKQELENIEGVIKKAINNGKFSCTYDKFGEFTDAEINMILEELRSLGFQAVYDRNTKPVGCPSDQWSPYSYLKINWEDCDGRS